MDTQRASLQQMVRSGAALSQQQEILMVMNPAKVYGYSMQELAKAAKLEVRSVTARCNELRNAGLIEWRGGKRKCSVSGRTIRPLFLPAS